MVSRFTSQVILWSGAGGTVFRPSGSCFTFSLVHMMIYVLTPVLFYRTAIKNDTKENKH